MTQNEIDIMWQQAMKQSIEDGEMFTRYHFAKLVAERALAQEKALQALHNENERLGLYKDAYAEQEKEQKKPQNCGTGYCSCIECVMKPEPDDIASIIACRNMLDAQPVPPRRTEGKSK